jgi:hypothetical protein
MCCDFAKNDRTTVTCERTTASERYRSGSEALRRVSVLIGQRPWSTEEGHPAPGSVERVEEGMLLCCTKSGLCRTFRNRGGS